MELYQSLVAVNPGTLIASICNLFIQLFLFKKLFWDKILNILDQRRQAADQEISDAKAAHAEAHAIKATYEENMRQAKEKADSILMNAQKTATLRSEEIIGQAQAAAAQIKSKASADIARPEISFLASLMAFFFSRAMSAEALDLICAASAWAWPMIYSLLIVEVF